MRRHNNKRRGNQDPVGDKHRLKGRLLRIQRESDCHTNRSTGLVEGCVCGEKQGIVELCLFHRLQDGLRQSFSYWVIGHLIQCTLLFGAPSRPSDVWYGRYHETEKGTGKKNQIYGSLLKATREFFSSGMKVLEQAAVLIELGLSKH
ncbi:hypothetical protein MAP00_000093 [Monascus purpureus]|nr:hypothetical protein MAP00_000093 [Monascus purpureus]